MSDAESGNSELVLGAFTYVILFASIGGFGLLFCIIAARRSASIRTRMANIEKTKGKNESLLEYLEKMSPKWALRVKKKVEESHDLGLQLKKRNLEKFKTKNK